MSHIIYIFFNILLPIFIQIIAGFVIQKIFKLNVSTMAKLQFYILIPALLFTKITGAEIDRGTILSIVAANMILFILLYLTSWLLARALKLSRPSTGSFVNSVAFYNSGNFCIPLIQLLFNNSLAFSVQIIIMVMQNLLTNTVGILTSNAGNKSFKQSLLAAIKVPMMYSSAIAIFMRYFHIGVWSPIGNSLEILGQGLVPIALITLGAQLAHTKINLKSYRVYLSNAMRLIVAPLIAWVTVLIMGLHGTAAQVMIIAAASPTAVNTVLMAIEYDNEPDFASQAVFSSTVFSAVTVAAVISLATTFV